MATVAFSQYAKSLNLSSNHTYSYVYIPCSVPFLSTVLFLHGFPSSCYDWRHQIRYLQGCGYGILAPDLLGYGGTSKPASAEQYRTKRMAGEIAEILAHEKLEKVHAVAHDTGCTLLSRIADYHPNVLLSATFLAVPYSRSGEKFNLQAVNDMTKQISGKERFGYLSLFVDDEAGGLLDEHCNSFFGLFYSGDPEVWINHIGPTGAMKRWLQADRQGKMPTFITEEERMTHQRIMRGHYGSALNWFRVLVWNLNEPDEKQATPIKIPQPVLMVTSAPSPIQRPGVEAMMQEIADDLTIGEVRTQGHWLQLEAKDEVNSILRNFFERCDTAPRV
ncbi:hypothetical protein N7457_006520 [Penicillium paradoxum]|uniref:uncharacterized protein n=1 Tax=Penicillium paradoxum TaxID=176176 RepID=UPI002548FE99|nr:uncharacterized protein N7457_006520 [Penicillium paradoxum]KAJ5781360.1 hypothetical protein N7457_006520 [Penicillium paradoxum]